MGKQRQERKGKILLAGHLCFKVIQAKEKDDKSAGVWKGLALQRHRWCI